METLGQRRHYVKGTVNKDSIRCDHKNLEYFQKSEALSRRQARRSETPSAYDFVMEHLEGSKNPYYVASRRPDYMMRYERPVA